MISAFLEHLARNRGFDIGGALGDRETAEQASMRDVRDELDGDVRQPCDAREMGQLSGHDVGRTHAAAERCLVYEEPRGRRFIAVRIAWRASRAVRRALTSLSVTPGSTARIARA